MLCECYLTSLSPGHPFPLDPISNTPLHIHTHTDTHNPLPRQQVKQNNSLCHTIAPLPRSGHSLLYSMFFFWPPLRSLLGAVCFFHTIVTLLKQEPVMVNCLTFLIVWQCCAVWSVSTWFSPIHQEWFVILDTFLGWELERPYVWYNPFLPAFVSVRFTGASLNLQQWSLRRLSLNRQRGFL